MRFSKQFLWVFLIELGTLGLLSGLAIGAGQLANSLIQGGITISAVKGYQMVFLLAAFLIWIVTRALVWRIIVERPRRGLLKTIGVSIPFMIVNLALFCGVLWLSFKALTPILLIEPSWLAYLAAYALTGVVLAPIAFNLAGLTTLSFYSYMGKGKTEWLFFGLPILKQKNLNMKRVISWEKHIYIVGFGFIVLTLLSQLVLMLQTYAALAVMAVVFACFLGWSKLYMLKA
jgi:hypothetical protein